MRVQDHSTPLIEITDPAFSVFGTGVSPWTVAV